MSSYEESDTNRSSGGGAKLFSPSNTDSAIKRATSILPGVKPREPPQTPHPSRRQPTSMSATMSGPPPPFNLPGASSSSHGTRKIHAATHPTSVSSHDEIEGYMSPESQRVRLVSPSTAQLMRSLQKINQDAKKSSETENLHPSIVAVHNHAASAIPRIWGLRKMIHNEEIGNTLDSDLLEITKSIINESATADSLGKELEAESRKAEKLQDELDQERRETDRLRSLLEQTTKQFRQFTLKSDEKLQVMSTRALTAEAALARSQASTPYQTSALTSPIDVSFPGPDPFSPAQATFPTGTPAPNQGGSTHGYSTGARSNYRASVMDLQNQNMATVNSVERMRLSRPTDRPTGASETGSPIPKNASLTTNTVTLQTGNHQDITLWQGEFNKLFTMTRNYVKTYWKFPPKDFAKTLQDHSSVWSYLLKLVNPTNPAQAQVQLTRLLSDKGTVSYVIERAILQFVVENVLSVDAWMDWGPATDKRLREVETALKTTEVNKVVQRQALGDERVAIVATRLAHQKWAEYRGYRKSCAFQGLRHIVGPMIGALRHNIREDAGYDLFSIIEEGWALSPKIWGSRLSFQTVFAGPDVVLTNDVQNVLDTGVGSGGPGGAGAAGGAAGGAGLRLAVTPLVTMRDDRGASLVPYIVVKTDVLVRK